MKYIGFDAESWLIARGRIAPRLVCFSWCDGATKWVEEADKAILTLEKYLRDPDVVLVSHNLQFDTTVACAYAPPLTRLIFEKYRAGLFRCTKIRQILIDIALGEFQFKYEDDGSITPQRYDLDSLCGRYGLPRLDKSGDSHRLRYWELDGIPAEQYPAAAYDYAADDAEAHLNLFLRQRGGQYIVNELDQCRQAFALQLTSCRGLRTDKAKVDEIERQLTIEAVALKEKMAGYGIFREDGTKDTTVLKNMVAQAFERIGLPVPTTDKGNIKTDADTLKLSGDDTLIALGDGQGPLKLLNTFVPTIKAAVDVPLIPGYEVMIVTGRTSSKNPIKQKKGEPKMGCNIQQLPRDRRDEKGNIILGIRNCFIPRKGFDFVSCDYSIAELRTLAEVHYQSYGTSALRQWFLDDIDPHLVMAADLLGKSLEWITENQKNPEHKKEIKDARTFAKCFHPDTEILTPEGWKKIDHLTLGDKVAAVYPDTNGSVLVWEKPTQLTDRFSEELVHLKNEGINLRVTPDHRMLAFQKNQAEGSTEIIFEDCSPEELNKKRGWLNAAVSESETLEVDERTLRLAVATQADGSFSGNRIRFGFTRERKIKRMNELFGFAYTIHKNGKNPDVTHYSIPPEPTAQVKALLDEKKFPWWWLKLSRRCREIVLEEARFWDSSTSQRGVAYSFVSVVRQNVEVLQALAAMTGLKTRLVIESRGKYPDAFKLTVRTKGDSRGGNVTSSRQKYNDRVVCLSVPSSYVLVRDGGVPVVTGQCGNFGVPGGLGEESLVDYARTNFNAILSRQQAQNIISTFHKNIPEQRRVFEDVKQKIGPTGGTVTQVLGQPIVHGRRSFTQACNLLFQGSVAQIAKEALWRVVWECYLGDDGWGGKPNPLPSSLYGSFPVAFVHDELILEVPNTDRRERHNACMCLSFIMEQAAAEVHPNVPPKAPPALMTEWTKEAEPMFDSDGFLIPWFDEKKAKAA